ncbi:hypothetical protein HPC49_03040 [Pyxidicoccus fallax]|uniref:Uncharacterized protein n=1 Tax=Pyxidicoccus fallax TaxID=394095 RepID=A0A848LFE3_9BACT|nr:hypothetical protein [Pyxidicoccus fallax]NMO15635.1 hypothetical protein [Pyxidicoccus fallax]NPC77232.1 hypothetical protein [Pyxidicoccus fallax]
MADDRLKKSDLIVISRTPGFDPELGSSTLQLTASGLAYYQRWWFSSPGHVRHSEQAEHRFNESAMSRIRSLLEGLPPPVPPAFIMEDAGTWEFAFWSGEEVRVVSIYDMYLDESTRERFGNDGYPAFHRLRTLWSMLHLPFKKQE